MKNFTFLLLSFLVLSSVPLLAQEKNSSSNNIKSPNSINRCSSMEYNEQLMKQYPNMKNIGAIVKNLELNNNAKTSGPPPLNITRIPVVVHVIHNGEPIGTGPNLSDAHVQSQIDVLNQDFRRQSGTRGFNNHPDGADTKIEFYLAKEDPNCNPTTGIDRIDYSSVSTSWSGPGGNTDAVLKPETIWDSSRYLNIWTVNFSNNQNLGYAQFPGGPEDTDGVVIGYNIFGSEDAPGVNVEDITYNLGRTTTHEVGHFFGLYHTFNGLSCSGDGDFISDTPQTNQENYGCPSPIPDSCVGGENDMIENYMDYTDDICMNIFTNGQSAVMNSFLSDPNFRLDLANSNVSDTPLPEVSNDGSIAVVRLNEDACSGSITPEVRVGNFGTTTITSAFIHYNINGGSTQTFNYSGTLAQGETDVVVLPQVLPPDGANFFQVEIDISGSDERVCNDDDQVAFFGQPSYTDANQIELTLKLDNFPQETTWSFKDGTGTEIASGGGYSQGSDSGRTIVETFNVGQEECYSFTISDSEGDGICCGFGNGFYELRTDDGTLIYTGGEFLSVETTQISTLTLSNDDYFADNSIRLFPNPTSTNVNIRVGSNGSHIDGLEVYNMLGQKVLTKEVNTPEDQSIDVTTFNAGMYFIKLYKDGSSKSVSFIKK